MNTPPVRYVTTKDGCSIAYTVCGNGQPFVLLPAWTNHVQDVWASNSSWAVWQALSERFRLINYDARGMGMSTRGLSDELTLDSYFLDLDAVLERLDIQRFVLLGSHSSALLAGHYAARHPERVSALILMNSGVSWLGTDIPSLWNELPRQSWEAFLYTLMPKSYDGEVVEKSVEKLKQWVTQQDYLSSAKVWRYAGLEGVVESIQTPTLVLKPQHCPCSRVEATIELASRLPNGRLVLMDSDRAFGGPEQAVSAIESFLAGLEADGAASTASFPGGPQNEGLPPRQLQVLRLIADGKTNGEIADELVISLRTVERHVAELYARLGVRNRVEAAAFAMNHLARA